MVRVTPTYKILGVWGHLHDFHRVSLLILEDFLPTRTPLSTLEPPPPALRGRIKKSSMEMEIYRKHTPPQGVFATVFAENASKWSN